MFKHLLVALSRCPDATAIVRTTRLAANGTGDQEVIDREMVGGIGFIKTQNCFEAEAPSDAEYERAQPDPLADAAADIMRMPTTGMR